MNDEHESPIDPTYERETSEARERLDQIERRLKAARPRPPQLDMAALERLARQTTADTPVRVPGRGRRAYRRVAVLAGSWACGATVGALVMFVLMSHTAPGTDSTGETAQLETEPPMPAALNQQTAPDAGPRGQQQNGPSTPGIAEPPDMDAGVLAMILDPFGSGDSAYWEEGRTFQAGMHLGHRGRGASGAVDRTMDRERELREDAAERGAEMQKESGDYLDPSPAITRERLLREVLSGMSGSVL